jgi:anti-sigma factor RsiW
MEAERKPDEILLNAMVDGELAPAEHAAAAARLAGDREFARAYATLTSLKAGIAEIAEDRDLDIRLSPPASRQRIAAIGISMALAAAVTIAAFMPMFVPGPEMPSAIAPAKDVVAVSFAVDPVIPDLSPAGLQLARTVVSAIAGRQALVATYIGPRGCRLELWVSNASASANSANGTDRRSWHVGGLAYELIAYGMPTARFEKVAEAAERATRATVLPEDIDQRLIEARVSTAPCVT